MNKRSIHSDVSTANVEHAVRAESVSFCFKSLRKKNYVLKDLSIGVAPSSIYVIVGPSGAGKSTLLKIVSGILPFESGLLRIFGRSFKNWSAFAEKNKPTISLMPDRSSLPQLLTCQETVDYFGTILGMSKSTRNRRMKRLMKSLQIPINKQLIDEMDLNQEKMLAFLCSVFHRPNLVMLDDPFEGLDPQSINQMWNILIDLIDNYETAVIITCKNPQYSQRADRIGVMFHGKIVAQDSPSLLLRRYQAASVHDLCLKICSQQVNGIEGPFQRNRRQSPDFQVQEIDPFRVVKKNSKKMTYQSKFARLLTAQFKRSILEIIRSPISLLILFITPTLLPIITFSIIGKVPNSYRIGMVVQEVPMYDVVHASREEFSSAFDSYLVPFYPQLIKDRLLLYNCTVLDYSDLDDAVDDVESNRLDAALHFRTRFSEYFAERIMPFKVMSNESTTIYQSTIHLYLDLSNFLKSIVIQFLIQFALMDVISESAPALGLREEVLRLPIVCDQSIYGQQPGKNLFASPEYFFLSSLVAMSFGFSLLYGFRSSWKTWKSGESFLHQVSGFRGLEFLLSKLICEGFWVILSAFVSFNLNVFLLKLNFLGPYEQAALLYVMVNVLGFVNGFFVASLFNRLAYAVTLGIASFLVFLFSHSLFASTKDRSKILAKAGLFCSIKSVNTGFQSIFLRKDAPYSSFTLPGLVLCASWISFFVFLTIVSVKTRRL